MIILAIAGMANIIRTLRATMLDELRKQYVTVARSKGLSEYQVIMQYPVRIAINPILSQTTYLLAWLFSGGTVVEIVINLNTAGPVLWRALLQQDMYTAGAYILILGVLYSLGSLLSDLLLAASIHASALGPWRRHEHGKADNPQGQMWNFRKKTCWSLMSTRTINVLSRRAVAIGVVEVSAAPAGQLAMVVLGIFYFIVIFAEFISP